MRMVPEISLRSVDAAPPTLDIAEQERAAAALERIIGTPASVGDSPPPPPTPARRSRSPLVLVPTAAGMLIIAAVVLQLGSKGGDAAYASWSATPAAISNDDLDAATAACEAKLRRFAGDSTSLDPDSAKLVLAERRGDHVALLYRTDDPDISTTCFMRSPPGSTRVDDLEIGSGGSTGPALKAPPRGFTQGAVEEFHGASITDGGVGEAVSGVTIHAGALTVQASLDNGRYAAWWPGPAFESGRRDSGGRSAQRLNLTYDLTMTDGTVVQNAQPTRPR